MDKKILKAKRQVLAERVRKYGARMERVPDDELAQANENCALKFSGVAPRRSCWISWFFFVQVYEGQDGIIRLAITRNELDETGEWKDGITWDEIQQIKREIGYGELDAVEIFPADSRLVYVANVRHLWVYPEPHPHSLYFASIKATTK